MSQTVNTIVIGGGQAGLATGYQLKRLGVDHVILDENEDVGAAWRKRWDSLRLFTPGRYSVLPGMPFQGPPHSLLGKDDIADYLQHYADRFDLPVRTGVKVDQVTADGDRLVVEAGDDRILADNVVVATGAFHNPRVPDFADTLDPSIIQMHSSDYRRPSQIQEGPVLVVGAGQSGAEIALDLIRDHEVWLSGEDRGEQPAGPGPVADRIVEPIMVFAATKVINVANPIGRKVRDHFLYPPRGIPRAGGTRKTILESGIEWVGRTTGTKEGHPELEDGRVLEVDNVIWCTGFVPDYSWIDFPIFDGFGYPIHERGVVASQPGLYFMGLLFQRTLSSALIMGVGKDAAYVAEHIRHRQPARHPSDVVH
ncbi:MAG TPA: NAD(P)-binding domain-containing protein [Acidimicrobiia bacterium]